MSNIVVNEICNLRCPYCFASEFVNKKPKEMTMEDFKTALHFALSDRSDRQIGIIGGEPCLYPHINEALRMALEDVRADPVMIYTNGVELEKIDPQNLEDAKFRMLVNVNSPEDMGQAKFDKMRENLLKFKNEHFGEGRFRLSVNLYKPDFDYTYIIPIVQELGFDTIRLSISVPAKADVDSQTALDYFRTMKPVALAFIGDMIRCGCLTGFDCNFLPECVLTDEEHEGLQNVKDIFYSGLSKNYSRTFWQRAILCETHTCTPVIDILPDLTAIRCFGLSEYTKVPIAHFRNMKDLRQFYVDKIDRPLIKYSSSPECQDCYMHESGNCSGGCHIFRIKQLFGDKVLELDEEHKATHYDHNPDHQHPDHEHHHHHDDEGGPAPADDGCGCGCC